jgi:DNA (cytosine-5)-methyltransferase 1
MLFPQMLLDLHDELLVDLFAGGGGASHGIKLATGRDVDHAINHDAAAVALHEANHPQTKHHTCDVFEVDPRTITQGRPVGLLWASPDCTDFSKAKGGKPIRKKKRRALAWVVKRWAGQVRPRVIMLENVEEFTTWGPLVGTPGNLRRCEKRKGKTFRRFVRDLTDLGYEVQWRELRACDYGAPTIRKRLFLIARCDGRPIVWPEKTHGTGKGLKPYRTAAECIDWSIPMLSIFATREEAKEWARANRKRAPKRPLASATMRRIARGVYRFVLTSAKPYIVGVGGRQGQSLERGVDQPYQTITAKGDSALIAPVIGQLAYGEGSGKSARWGIGASAADEPLPTIAAGGGNHAVIAPYIVPNNTNNAPQSVEDPTPTVTGGGRNILAAPLLVPRYGEREGQEPRTRAIDEPLPTIVPSGNGASLCAAFIAKHFTGVDGAPLQQPAPTVTTIDHNALVAASLTKLRGTSSNTDPTDPLHTVSAGGTHHGLVAAHLSHLQTHDPSGGQGDPGEPLRTQTSRSKAAVVYAFMQKYYGQGVGVEVSQPVPTVTTKDRMGLVTVAVGGVLHVIIDIAMRMLQPRELYNAQGFPPDYRINVKVWDPKKKRMRWLTQEEQVRMVGNSVSPVHPATMVRANLPELITRDEAKVA